MRLNFDINILYSLYNNYTMMIIFIGLLILTVNSSKCKRVINNDAVYVFDGL